jgi:hypothetical protein
LNIRTDRMLSGISLHKQIKNPVCCSYHKYPGTTLEEAKKMGSIQTQVLLRKQSGDRIEVQKNFGENYLDGQETFRSLIQYALTPDPDELNPLGYSKEEITAANRIEDWMDTTKNVVLYSTTNGNPPERINLPPDDSIADYATKLFQEHMVKDDKTGDEIPVQKLVLNLEGGSMGGLRLEYLIRH